MVSTESFFRSNYPVQFLQVLFHYTIICDVFRLQEHSCTVNYTFFFLVDYVFFDILIFKCKGRRGMGFEL